MSVNPNLNYCQVCEIWLGMEDYDGICVECDTLEDDDYSYTEDGWDNDEDDFDADGFSIDSEQTDSDAYIGSTLWKGWKVDLYIDDPDDLPI